LDAVSLVLDQSYSRAETAKNLGINAQALGRPMQEHRSADDQAFRGNGKLTPERKEIRSDTDGRHVL